MTRAIGVVRSGPVLCVALGSVLLALRGIAERAPHPYLALALLLAALAAVSAIAARREPSSPARVAAAAATGIVAVTAAATISPAPALAVPTVVPALNALAAVAEEAFFRGPLFDLVCRRAGDAVAVVATAAAFAAVHVPLYGWAALPVDLGAGLLFGWQRRVSGTWIVPAVTHGLANLLVVMRP